MCVYIHTHTVFHMSKATYYCSPRVLLRVTTFYYKCCNVYYFVTTVFLLFTTLLIVLLHFPICLLHVYHVLQLFTMFDCCLDKLEKVGESLRQVRESWRRLEKVGESLRKLDKVENVEKVRES